MKFYNERSKVFEAMFGDTCEECLQDIKPGDQVLYLDDDLIHEGCQ